MGLSTAVWVLGACPGSAAGSGNVSLPQLSSPVTLCLQLGITGSLLPPCCNRASPRAIKAGKDLW